MVISVGKTWCRICKSKPVDYRAPKVEFKVDPVPEVKASVVTDVPRVAPQPVAQSKMPLPLPLPLPQTMRRKPVEDIAVDA